MKPKTRPTARLGRLTARASLAMLAAPLVAQTPPAPPADAKDPIQLSPFTVNAQDDRGYQAQHSLAGSRLKTDLKDIANPISAFTEQFFLDTAITDTNDLANYLLSTEANFNENAGSTGANQNLISTGNARPVRVRGLSGGALTTNFFNTGGVADTFSTERIEQARGPNALLFGVGNPGGVINSTTKRARLDRTSTTFGAQLRSEEGSRLDFDHNQPIIGDKVGVRVAGVRGRYGSYRAWDFRNTDGLFATGKWRIASQTELNVEGERMRVRRHTSRTFTAFDAYTPWRDAGMQLSDSLTAVPALGIGKITNATTPRFIYTTNNGDFADWRNKNQTNTKAVPATINPDTGAVLSNIGNPPLTDFSVLPPEATFAGPGNEQKVRTSRISAYLTQTLGRSFNLELAAMRLSEHRDVWDPQQDISQYLRADPNITLPTRPGQTVGDANPFAGMAYMEGMPTHDTADEITDFLRASANYRFSLGKFGNHMIAGVAQRDRVHSDRQSLRQYIISANAPTLRDPNTSAAADNNRVFQRTYIDINGPVDLRTQANPQEVPVGNFVDRRTGQTYTTAYIPFDANTRFLGSTQESLIGMLQSTWFGERLRTIVGASKDNRDAYNSQQIVVPNTGGNGGFLTPVAGGPGTTQEATSVSFSTVFRVNRFLNLTYSRARNNGLPSNSGLMHTPTTRPPVAEGRSEDVGFKLTLLENRLFLTAVYFETSADNDNETGTLVPSADVNRIWAALNTHGVRDASGRIVAANTENSNASTFSSRTQGYEAELTANILPNWRVFANYSRALTVRSNYAPEMVAYLQEIMPFWTEGDRPRMLLTGTGFADTPRTDNGTIDTVQEMIDDVMETAGDNLLANEGKVFLGQRKHKFNARTNYDFVKGPLKNFAIGGAARYQSEPVIGYQTRIRGTGANRTLEKNVVMGSDLLSFDANISYGRRSNLFGRNVRWVVQLNVNNVLEDDPVYMVTRVQQSGEVSMYRFNPPRSWILSCRVGF